MAPLVTCGLARGCVSRHVTGFTYPGSLLNLSRDSPPDGGMSDHRSLMGRMIYKLKKDVILTIMAMLAGSESSDQTGFPDI